MIRLILLLLTLSFSTVFLFIPNVKIERYKPYNYEGKVIMIDTWALPVDEGFIDWFPFSDQKLSLETHLFFLFEHLILVLLAITLYMGATQYRTAFFVYVIIQALDTLIYLLAYGNFGFTDIPVTWNSLKLFVFLLAIGNEIWKRRG